MTREVLARCASVQPGSDVACERHNGHGGQHWARFKTLRWGERYKRAELAKPQLERDLAADKAARRRRPRGPRCSVCMQPGELEGGRCKDRKACAERAPMLDLGI